MKKREPMNGYAVVLQGECAKCGHVVRLVGEVQFRDPGASSLTSRQKEVYDTIRKYREQFGVVPTFSTLAELIGVSSLATVHEMLRTLESKGWLELNGGPQSMILRGE